MRSVVILCLLLVVLVPTTPRAQGPDTIGLWFDPDYTLNTMPVPIGVPFFAYLVLHDPSAESVAGASFAFGFGDANLFVLSSEWTLEPAVQVVDGCTTISYETPRPAEAAMLLTTFIFLDLTDAPVLFFVLPCAGQPCASYLPPGQDPICMTTVFPDGVVACLGCEVGVDETTWSAVKRLYR